MHTYRKLLCGLASLALTLLPASAQNNKDREFPEISIETVNGELPTYELAIAPEGCWVTGITNNKKVPGRMVMTLAGDTLYDSGDYVQGEAGVRIKIRGNSTATFEQKPYRLKLSKKADLLTRGDKAYKHKDWVLMTPIYYDPGFTNMENVLLSVVGRIVGENMELGWMPQGRFVTLKLNGEYAGLYYLIEAVARGEKRINVDDDGFIFENDAYWWNSDGYYFKTNHQIPQVGYTFKYPDEDALTEEDTVHLRNYLNAFEDALYGGDDNYAQWIDLPSFASWLLGHDIMGTHDSGGSNQFLYKKNYTVGDSLSTKVFMGPMWDFDSCFMPWMETKWSYFHQEGKNLNFYYPELLQRQDFCDEYMAAYYRVKDNLEDILRDSIEAFVERYDSTYEVERQRWHELVERAGNNTLRFQADEMLAKLHERFELLKTLTANEMTTAVATAMTNAPLGEERFYDLQGRALPQGSTLTSLPPGIYIGVDQAGRSRKYVRQ